MKYRLGIDIGSVSVKLALLDETGGITYSSYKRHYAKPYQTLIKSLEALDEITTEATISITGMGARVLATQLGIPPINEVVAQARAHSVLLPRTKSVVEIGGNDSKLILIGENGTVADFAMNTICAAGTGSFLDQQASRMGFAIEQMGEIAAKSTHPARVAGRCSVFAKSDMIHLQQEGTSDYDILAGLCFAMARNFRATVVKGHNLPHPVSFAGGVAANAGMARALREVFELSADNLLIHEKHKEMVAIGAALSLDVSAENLSIAEFSKKLASVMDNLITAEAPLSPLTLSDNQSASTDYSFSSEGIDNQTPVFLGIDVGSISTNVVAIDENGNVLARRYLATAGRPIEAVRQGISEVGTELGSQVNVVRVGVTGSGRYMIGDFVGADIVRNEITAQARAAVFIDPAVDTIFEIGGQDSKYISLENAVVVDFEMNKVCAAGTGSFLEEQAERLGISIVEEFGRMALGAPAPVPLGEKCTVFMDADLTHYQSQGASQENLVAGLAYSIVFNYLNRVVMGKKVGKRIFFQGGVAANKGVVAAFEKALGRSIIVPPNHDVTGAIGVALLARDEMDETPTRWKGFSVAEIPYRQESFECHSCPNLCDIRRVDLEGSKPLYYGSRCDKYEQDTQKRGEHLPDLFAEREKLLWSEYDANANPEGPQVAIPRALTFHELWPFWASLLKGLGAKATPTPATNRSIINRGVAAAASESCFPSKVALGHILEALDSNAPYILIPSVISLPRQHLHIDKSFACPYVETLPWVAESTLELNKKKTTILTPRIQFRRPTKMMEEELWRKVAKPLGATRTQLKQALKNALQAYETFDEKLKAIGRKTLEGLSSSERVLVIVSRSYNGCDQEVSLGLANKVRDLGVLAFPMDMLPLDEITLGKEWDNMYWRYGQKLLEAAELIARDSRLFAVYMTNFGCGPDSYITHFFRHRLSGKPYLQLEIDEHSAAAGAITRLEAFLDSIKNARDKAGDHKPLLRPAIDRTQRRTLYIPYMCDQAFAAEAAFRAAGIPAVVMDMSDGESLTQGRRFTSGKECYPGIITTGDMVKIVSDPGFKPGETSFFMPAGSGPCRFGQYNMMHRMVLSELGLSDVPIYSPNQGKSMYEDLGMVGNDFELRAWRGMVALDLLEKALLYLRPREKNPGETQLIYQRALNEVRKCLEGNGNLEESIRRVGVELAAVPVYDDWDGPTIGIVGEIYVRTNRFANNDLIAKLESLGAAVRVPPITEWFLYTNHTRQLNSRIDGEYKRWLINVLIEKVQVHLEKKLIRAFAYKPPHLHEPTIKRTLSSASHYLDPIYEGEAILSLGKTLDFSNTGASGVVNVMPLGCMPGNIVCSILKRVRSENEDYPILNMMYEGMEDTHDMTRLEAFVFQAREWQKQHPEKD